MEMREKAIEIFRKIVVSPLIIVLVAAGIRLLPHEPNVTPIGALALFGGADVGDGGFRFLFGLS